MIYDKDIALFIKSKGQGYFNEIIDKLKNTEFICIFGAGRIGLAVAEFLCQHKVKVDCFIDNDEHKWGKKLFRDIMCISPKELSLSYDRDHTAILLTMAFYDKVYEELLTDGLKNVYNFSEYKLMYYKYITDHGQRDNITGNITELLNCVADDYTKKIITEIIKNWFCMDIKLLSYKEIYAPVQYYGDDVIKLTQNESFVDAGAYNGDSILQFIAVVSGNFKQIHAFELDKGIYKSLAEAVEQLDDNIREKIYMYNLGIWDKYDVIRYSSLGIGTKIDDKASELGHVVPLDDILLNEEITFIKMDIEGAEMEALRGAESIIRLQKPKLAICIYHRPEHLWEIPLYLKRLVPEYKIYIRHHSVLEYETVCYATV